MTDDADRFFLVHGFCWDAGRYSVVAGFVETGECAEAAVVRETASTRRAAGSTGSALITVNQADHSELRMRMATGPHYEIGRASCRERV